MSVTTRLIIKTDTNGVDISGQTANLDAPTALRKCADLLGRAAQGAANANVQVCNAPVYAQAKLTCTNTGTNGDTFVIGNVSCEIVTSGATGNQVNVAADAAALATAIAALVNSSASFTGICTATNPSSGVVVLTAAVPGLIGNGLQLSENSTSITLSNAFGSLTAGTDGTNKRYSLGLNGDPT